MMYAPCVRGTPFLDGSPFIGHPVSFTCVLLEFSRGLFFLFGLPLPGTRHPFFRPVRSSRYCRTRSPVKR